MSEELDMEMRRAAFDRVRALSIQYADSVPIAALREGFVFAGERISFGSFYSGIFRPKQFHGPAALCLVTAPPKSVGGAPYDDEYDEATGQYLYHYRTASSDTEAARRQAEFDNRALRAAHELAVPLIYFHGIEPGRYSPVHPMFVTHDDPVGRVVTLQAALPIADVGDDGLKSGEELRRYATREVRVRLHQHRFRSNVMRAYRGSCAVCALRVASLVQAAHIIEDGHPDGTATVVNGIALCAIHHLAYDRNVVGIDPSGVVHIARDLLDASDGPMLRFGLQEFHSAAIRQPRSKNERPDPERLEIRYEQFKAA